MMDTLPEQLPEMPVIKPKLYSKRAIRLFSIFFSTLAGGILLRQNLKDVGNDRAASTVLTFSILFTIGISVLANYIPGKAATPIGFLLNVIGSFILNEYFFEKLIPESDSYEKKPVWKPLIIWLAICTVVIFIILSGGALNKP